MRNELGLRERCSRVARDAASFNLARCGCLGDTSGVDANRFPVDHAVSGDAFNRYILSADRSPAVVDLSDMADNRSEIVSDCADFISNRAEFNSAVFVAAKIVPDSRRQTSAMAIDAC